MLKKIVMLIFIMFVSVFGYYVYTVATENKYNINLEEELIVDGITYEKMEDNWVTEELLDSDPIGRVNNGLTDYFVSTKIHRTKSDKCLALRNMYKTEMYIEKELNLPEFKRCNIEYIILNNERVKRKLVDTKQEIKDEQMIDYLYELVKDTHNKPNNELLNKLENTSFVEVYSLQFKLKGVEDIYIEPSIIVSSTDGDMFIYNKNADYLDEDGMYNLYLVKKEKSKSIFREEVR